MTTEVVPTDDGPVRTLTLSDPERLNAIGPDTAEALHDAVVEAGRDDAVRALIITGAGKHFSAGGDAEGVLGLGSSGEDDEAIRFMRSYQRAASAVWHSPLPVIAAVSGVAYGGALNLALLCDLVVCTADARLCEVFLQRDVVPDFGGAFTLPRAVGLHRAKELMLLAEELGAERAHELGLVNAVVESKAEALRLAGEWAATLASRSRLAVSLTKRMLQESGAGTFGSALELEALSQAFALASPSAQSAFGAFRGR